MKKLTDKQEAFVQALLIPNTSQREAYKKAYNASRMKDGTIDNKASLLLKKEQIRARYDQLRDRLVHKAEDKAIITALGLLTDLKDIIDRNKTADDRVALDAIKTGMKHLGMLTDKVVVTEEVVIVGDIDD
ncbi:MAG: hypothetical protein GY804_01200 [Alphaproteobacteria bacterium]|nr:hypothetical protein [Alphaproteobacteria bacterium]